MTKPLVSVVLIFRDEVPFLEEAIESVRQEESFVSNHSAELEEVAR